jgi:hypothetical protein
VAIAASTISANRMVYADGSVNRLFLSGSGTAVSVWLISSSSLGHGGGRRPARRHGGAGTRAAFSSCWHEPRETRPTKVGAHPPERHVAGAAALHPSITNADRPGRVTAQLGPFIQLG